MGFNSGFKGLMNTDNTVLRNVCLADRWGHCAIARNVCSSAVYESPNSAYERQIGGENL